MNRLLQSVVLLGMLLGSSLLQAHYLDIARFAFFETEESGRFRLLVDNLPENIRPDQPVSWPPGCNVLERRESSPRVLPRVEFDIRCEAETEGRISTRWGQDGGMLERHYLDGRMHTELLAGNSPGMTLDTPDWQAEAEARSFAETAWLYLVLGTEHVLIGWDHLAFVFCLSMLASGVALIWLISSFTVGHSVSLALAHFGIVDVPIAPVEAVIALSVVFMAREAFFEQRRRWRTRHTDEVPGSVNKRGRLALTAGFGLIHGLGFASVLGGLGVSASETVVALLFFNIGVEVGQVMFVMLVVGMLLLLRRIRFDRVAVRAGIALVGAMGMVWTLQRIVGM